MQSMKANKFQGGRPRFAGKEFRAGPPPKGINQKMGQRDRLPLGKAKRTGNMIMKAGKRPQNPEGARRLKGMPMKVSYSALKDLAKLYFIDVTDFVYFSSISVQVSTFVD